MVTIYEVAQRAGVTKSTVSNVITGKVPVREATRKRVLAAIEELGYQPNLMARGLKQGKTYSIALMVPKLSNPFYTEIVEAIEETCGANNYNLILCMTGYNDARIRKHFQMLANRTVEGLIVYNPIEPEIKDITALSKLGLPIVIGGWENELLEAPGFPMVNINFRITGSLATKHLLELGHTRFGIIAELPSHNVRMRGMLDMLDQAQLTLKEEHVRQGSSNFESGYRQARELLSLPGHPTALFTTNDLMALGALQAAYDLQIEVPAQLSIVGVDNIENVQYSRPPLTTVALPKREFGRELIDYLFRLIQEPERHMKATTLLHPELIVRESTAPPPREC